MTRAIAIIFLALFAQTFAGESEAGQCVGKFANPMTDICWSCMFPISIGSTPVDTSGQEDNGTNPPNVVCTCQPPLRVGVTVGYWEPIRRADVTRSPYCFVSLGGVSINPGIHAPEGEVREQADLTKQSSYQVHWYSDPVLYWLELVLDDPCLETGKFDVSYLTEVDPTWNDDELTDLLQPEAFLFGNPIAQAACAGDCVLASAGWGSQALFWCSGCNGSVYPMNGHVQAHISHIQASSLILHRFLAKSHRELMTMGTSGVAGLCGPYPMPILPKDDYKYTMLYPVPQTQKIAGKCCQPLGRTTALWGAGRAYPIKGEDFSYEVFRKKNCCLGVVVAP